MKEFATIILLLLMQAGFSQTAEGPRGADMEARSGRIRGTIIDAGSSQPMEYANVAIYNKADSSLVTGGITNSQGEFEIGGLSYGQYYVEANFIGYEKKGFPEVRLVPARNTIDVGKVELSPSTLEIGGVEVVADRQRVEYKIDKKVINVSQDINAAGGTAVDVLENTPSVEVDIEGNVSLRGSSSFTVLIDGRPSVLSGSDALRQLPASAIENIEIITNPSAKYDPDGMAGIINVVMKKNVLAGFNGIINASVGTGDKYRSDLTLNYRTKKSNLFFGVDWSDDTFYGKFFSDRETILGDTSLFVISRGNRDNNRGGFNLKGGVDFYLSDRATLTLSGTGGRYAFSQEGGSNLHEYTLPARLDRYISNRNLSAREGNQYNANISFQQKFNQEGTHKLDLLAYYANRNGDDTETQDEYLSNNGFTLRGDILERIRTTETDHSDDYRFKADYVRPTGANGRLEAGWQSLLERESEDYRFENFDPESERWQNNTLYSSSMEYQHDVHAGYFTCAGKAGKLDFMAGLRAEYTNRSIDHAKVAEPYTLDRFDLFPSGHLSYGFGKGTQLMASYSRRINRPGGRDLDPFPNYMDQYTIRVGNPDLKPEYTNSWEAGLMQRFGGSFLSLEAFYRTTDDLISRIQELRDDGIMVLTSTNVNSDASLGTELMGNINITKWFLLNTSLSVFNYKIKGDLNGQSIDRESTNYSLRGNATFKVGPTSRIQWMSYFRGPSVSAQGETGSFFFSNLSVRQDFLKRKLTATLALRDVFGTMNFENSSSGPNFNSKFRMERESRVVQLTLSYTINNYKSERNGNQSGDNGGNGMNMEMEF